MPNTIFSDPEKLVYKAPKGLSADIVDEISSQKQEPRWMRDFRRRSLKIFAQKKMPIWGADLSAIKFEEIYYYLRPTEKSARRWEDVPELIKKTYEKIGIPRAERELLAGVTAQYESEIVYSSLLKNLKKQGVVFLSMDEGLKEHPELVKEYFGKLIPPADNKFAALNSAVWSGGSFVYVPKGVKIELPLQAYFRINAANVGQFERTLIIADEGADLHYVEGCTAPVYSTDSLHAAVVEIFVKKGARVRYTTIQNWSKNVYNLVTKRARVEEGGIMEWVDCNLGSKVSMKYPSCLLAGRGARGEVLSLNFAGTKQVLDTGGKMIHLAPKTSGIITSKSLSKDGGRASYRGLVYIQKGARGTKSKVRCDALILDEESSADTFPHIKINENQVEATHEAVTGKLNEEQLFYLRSRGLDGPTAESLLINGFIEPIVKELPMEYAVELNRLVQMEMEGAVG
jgi:Fe-S cluster assembly protein SufB